MVKNSGTQAGSRSIRALNLPAPIEVEEDGGGKPIRIALERRRLQVTHVNDVWEIADEWWRPMPIARRYFRIALEEGPAVTVFHDLTSGLWYRQQG